MRRLGKARARNFGTDIIIHHCFMDALDHTAELIRVLSAAQQSRDFASPFQWSEFSKDLLKFPSKL